MANVTDAAFRHVINKLAPPSVMWTEFVSCEALTHDATSRKRMEATLMYKDNERPTVVQLFGSKPEQFYESALIVKDMGFDGIDINMGCPEHNVIKQQSGAALILHPHLAQSIITETMRAAGGDIPVSVKTRIGFHHIDYHDWILRLLSTEPEALTIHGRTRDEMSNVPAHWDVIGDVANIAKQQQSSTLIIGNGDVANVKEAKEKAAYYDLDGIMFGRALFGNPWLFQGHDSVSAIPIEERLRVVRWHTQVFEELLGAPGHVSFARMKKFYPSYLKGLPGAKVVRDRFVRAQNVTDVYDALDEYETWLESRQETVV